MRLTCVPVALLALAAAGCEDDPFTMTRADTGVVPVDGGTSGPLALEPGMTFVYQGILTSRITVNQEHNSTWFMTVTIDSVDDSGVGASSVTFSASDITTADDDWGPTDDYDSWVGRLGPSQTEDSVSMAGVVSPLDGPPEIPPVPGAGGVKQLPVAGTFFLDMRDIDAIRAAWAQAMADRRPRVGDPSDNAGRWVFESDGADTLQFFDEDHRKVRIEYDPRGFMVRIEENLGDPDRQTPPYASNRIVLMTGPN